MIEVTRIRKGDGKIKAFCDIEFDKKFAVKGFRVVENKDGGYFVGLPSKKGTDGVNYAMFLPRDEFKTELEKIILDAVLDYKPDTRKIDVLAVDVAKQLHAGVERIMNKKVSQYKDGKVRAISIMNYKFITQNPEKDTRYGKMAQKGHDITWAIRNDSEWIGKVINGTYTSLV